MLIENIRVTEYNLLSELELVLQTMGCCGRGPALYLLQTLPTPIDLSYPEFMSEVAKAINSLPVPESLI